MKKRSLQNIKLMKKIAALVLFGVIFIGIMSAIGLINSEQGLDAINEINDGAVIPNEKLSDLTEDILFIHQTAIGVMAATEVTGPAQKNTMERLAAIDKKMKELKPLIQNDPVLVKHLLKLEQE